MSQIADVWCILGYNFLMVRVRVVIFMYLNISMLNLTGGTMFEIAPEKLSEPGPTKHGSYIWPMPAIIHL